MQKELLRGQADTQVDWVDCALIFVVTRVKRLARKKIVEGLGAMIQSGSAAFDARGRSISSD